MGCKIIFSPQAVADLACIVRHIAQQDPGAAERVGHALIERVQILANFPLLGVPVAKRPGLQRLLHKPYLIFYRPQPERGRVEILRYWHGARGERPAVDPPHD